MLGPFVNEIYAGRVERGLSAIESILPRLSQDSTLANTLNDVCWFSALHRYSETSGAWTYQDRVLALCDQAVALDPDNADVADSRGLVRALSGDIAGAIADFQNYIDANSPDSGLVKLRVAWIAALRQGRFPFTTEYLAEIRGDAVESD
ncbi:hypothetical protein HC891_15755 [Candidatus Gracilibacteria bacterium]|nr:hypothetical protein [Candidatus Gracilibacteria bacterium]